MRLLLPLALLVVGCGLVTESGAASQARPRCQAGDAQACMTLGAELADREQSISALEGDLEDMPGEDQARIHDEHRERQDEIIAAYAHACQLGRADGCERAMAWLIDRDQPAAMTPVLVRGCELGASDLCPAAAALVLDTDRVHARTLAEAGCQHQHMASCTVLAALTDDPVRARELRAMACTAGDKPACVELGRTEAAAP
jgi:hypothetical protein